MNQELGKHAGAHRQLGLGATSSAEGREEGEAGHGDLGGWVMSDGLW